MRGVCRAAAALLAAAPVVAAARDTGPAQLDAMLRGRIAEAPVDCIDPARASGTRTIDGTAIVYDVAGRLYVNRPQGATSLRWDDILVTHVEGGELCRVDTIVLLDPLTRAQRGFVVLGAFTPYRRPR